MIWALLPIVFLLGFLGGLYFAAANQGKIIAASMRKILDEQGYEIMDGKITPKDAT